MKTWLLRGALAAVAAALLALAVSASGLIPIAASSGHWPITAWFLHFTMHRSVATHSIGIDPPDDLDDPGLVLRGAGHYDGGCRPCHGAPGERMPRIPAAMTPHPPRLGEPVRELDAEGLFYIVEHGIKFTGMPAWPARHREDEVWAVVAFLRRLPALDQAGYAELTRPSEPVRADRVPLVVRELCVRCHGADGRGRIEGAFPRLAGQREAYLLASLQAYARGERHSGIMEPIAVALDDADMARAAAYYAGLGSMDAEPRAGTSAGALIASDGIAEQNLPSCVDCHGPADLLAHPRHEVYPLLAGQEAWYLRLQLELFRAGHRGGTPYAHVMREVAAHELTDAQIRAVADYYAGLGERGADAPPAQSPP